MIPEKITNRDLDRIVRQVLADDKKLSAPDDITEKTIRRLEKRLLLKEIVLELVLKIGLILSSLIILTAILVWVNGKDLFLRLYTYFTQHWQVIISLVILVLFAILIDQILIKYFHSSRDNTLAESRS